MAVRYETHDGYAEIILDRPKRRNAISGPLGTELGDAFLSAGADDTVQAVLFRGEGGAFCSGLDLKEFATDPPPPWLTDWRSTWRRAHRAIYACDKPIVGALERFAINGGAALILACDFAFAGDNSFLQVGEVQLGMAAPYNLAWLALRFNESVNTELALVGDRVSGPDLARLGIVRQSVPDEDVLTTARNFTEKLTAYPAGAPARIKRTLRGLADTDIDAWFDTAIAHSAGGAAPPTLR
jgi:enoyl-CoA hydratase/carnithine racemase